MAATAPDPDAARRLSRRGTHALPEVKYRLAALPSPRTTRVATTVAPSVTHTFKRDGEEMPASRRHPSTSRSARRIQPCRRNGKRVGCQGRRRHGGDKFSSPGAPRVQREQRKLRRCPPSSAEFPLVGLQRDAGRKRERVRDPPTISLCSRITSESVVPRTAASAASDMCMTILRRRTGKPAMWPLCLQNCVPVGVGPVLASR